MYVAVKGGARAIANAHKLLDEERRGDPSVPELTLEQVREQLPLAVDRVMSEGSLYDPDLAALAVKQACGDLVEAIFLLRAYRTTLPRLAVSEPVDTGAMQVRRRISATFKDVPGGQVLGPTFDYTHRLLDFSLAHERDPADAQGGVRTAAGEGNTIDSTMPKVMGMLGREGLIFEEIGDGEGRGNETFSNKSVPNESVPNESEPGKPVSGKPVGDVTRDPLSFPADRDVRLQSLARGDEGFLLALAYSTQRGFGDNHPFAGEIRMGEVAVSIVPPELGFEVEIGDVTLTECEMVTSFKGSRTDKPRFTRGYGLTFGFCERKAMSMALVDRALMARELEEELDAPSRDEEFVLYHSDNVEASGFVQHLKLPHYVDFQADLIMVRAMQREFEQSQRAHHEQTEPAKADSGETL